MKRLLLTALLAVALASHGTTTLAADGTAPTVKTAPQSTTAPDEASQDRTRIFGKKKLELLCRQIQTMCKRLCTIEGGNLVDCRNACDADYRDCIDG